MAAPHLDVRYVARLARLYLDDDEVSKFQSQLAQVLAHVDQLRSLDVAGVEPTAHTHPVFNVLRADEPRDGLAPRDALANAPRQANDLFIVPKVVE